MTEGAVAVLKYKVLNPAHREIKIWKCTLKQIMNSGEYRDMLSKSRLFGIRSAASGQVPNKLALDWVACPGYSAEIIICIRNLQSYTVLNGEAHVWQMHSSPIKMIHAKESLLHIVYCISGDFVGVL